MREGLGSRRPGDLPYTDQTSPSGWTTTAVQLATVTGDCAAMRRKRRLRIAVGRNTVEHEVWLGDIRESCIRGLDLWSRRGPCGCVGGNTHSTSVPNPWLPGKRSHRERQPPRGSQRVGAVQHTRQRPNATPRDQEQATTSPPWSSSWAANRANLRLPRVIWETHLCDIVSLLLLLVIATASMIFYRYRLSLRISKVTAEFQCVTLVPQERTAVAALIPKTEGATSIFQQCPDISCHPWLLIGTNGAGFNDSNIL
ncbi:uncharacterized protein LOC132403784 [Hypanus sabinus]|uniref:uncharacterized protein LOC132403784 n=1 Tax=Hypanus sabinus TaxID=79690 RepID=UPI0028C39BBC|nr:uncharacterized protein LOC132403784 [Hypanus sabinus]